MDGMKGEKKIEGEWGEERNGRGYRGEELSFSSLMALVKGIIHPKPPIPMITSVQ